MCHYLCRICVLNVYVLCSERLKMFLPNLWLSVLYILWLSSSLRKRNKIILTSTKMPKKYFHSPEQADAFIHCLPTPQSFSPSLIHFFFSSLNQNFSISLIFHVILPLAPYSLCLCFCHLSPALGSEPFRSVCSSVSL